jgi:hypothetical protein
MNQIDERKKLITEYRKDVLPSVICGAQLIKSNSQKMINIGKELTEEMEDLIEITKIKSKSLEDHEEILLKSDEKTWTTFLADSNDDYDLPKKLYQLNSELEVQILSPVAMVAASGSTMTDTSSNVYNTIFSIVADAKQLPIEDVSSQYYDKSILGNKNTIRFCLGKILPNYLNEFNDVIRDWESKNFRDMKCLIGLRMIIFEKLFGLKCENKKYKTTNWYNNKLLMNPNVNGEGNDYYNKILYFIIGNKDPSKFPPSLIIQIVDLANKLSNLQEELSKFGKIREQQTSNIDVELIFLHTISFTAEVIKIREVINK